jgi:hypothetical protein
MDPSFIKVTPNFINTHIPPPTYTDKGYNPDITNTQIAFAFFSTYILFPLLYIILSTGNIRPIMMLWQFIQSGIFNTVHTIKEFLTDVVYTTLRVFGHYTFSTYTVVKNGREIYSASSMCFYKQSDVKSVYRIDRAKYNVCKWIDRQCKQYRIDNDGEDPELTETHNDIYDFIIHKVDNEAYVRIHRGDFSGRTHTLITHHYRPFVKRSQIADKAQLTVCLPISATVNTGSGSSSDRDPEPEPNSETFFITLKNPYNFFLEKNEFLDKKFLQWKLYNECGRKDVADYIGQPFSKYTLTLPYHDSMKKYMNVFNPKVLTALKENHPATEEDTPNEEQPVIYHMNDSHSILVGSRFVVKVDSVLRCPVFESNDSQVYDIDSMLTSYYNCSDSETDSDSDNDSDCDSEVEIEDGESESSEIGDDAQENNRTDADDPEFEMIEDPVQ